MKATIFVASWGGMAHVCAGTHNDYSRRFGAQYSHQKEGLDDEAYIRWAMKKRAARMQAIEIHTEKLRKQMEVLENEFQLLEAIDDYAVVRESRE